MLHCFLEEMKMQGHKANIVSQALTYIEANLEEQLELDIVADALHYSRFYLHRLFAEMAGITLHEYVKRRRLTRAAEELVFSGKTVMEIALASGYGSRQAFTDAFRAIYKKAPAAFRAEGKFYPLQLDVLSDALDGEPVKRGFGPDDIVHAVSSDAADWMELARLKIDGYPYFDELQYTENLYRCMADGRALILHDGCRAVGVLAFSAMNGRSSIKDVARESSVQGSIDFLAVHPQYRRLGVEELFLSKLSADIFPGGEIAVTTYRAGDKADTGYREMYRRLGFRERELLVEFGYPTQRFVFSPGKNLS